MTVAATNTDASYRSSASTTLSSVPIGSAFAGRVVVAYVFGNGGGWTIGGVSAVVHADGIGGAWIAAVVPTGTTANIVNSGATNVESYGVWSLAGDPSTTAAALADVNGSASDSIAASDDSTVLGIAIDTTGTGITPSWNTGLSNDGSAFDAGPVSARDGHVDIATAQTVNFSVSGTTAGNTILTAACFAAVAPPAFGDLLGTLQANANSITNPFAATGSVVVAAGDLVVSLVCQQTALTVTAVSDNLGNTYTAQNAGTDAGAVTGRLFYSIVTNAGTLTSVSATTTASTNDAVHIAAAFQGPFGAIDRNIANTTADVTSPFTCPSSGTLSQASEVVIAWGVANYGTSWSATSPNLLAIQLANSTTIKAAIGYQTVSATSAVSPAFTAGANPTQAVLGTLTFTEDAGALEIAIDAGSYAVTGQNVTLARGRVVAVNAGSYAVSGQAVTFVKTHRVNVDGGSYSLSGQDVSLTQTRFVTVDAGSYALTGQDVTLSKGQFLAIDGGSYAVTGQDVTLSHAWAVPVEAGSYDLLGTAVALIHDWIVTVEAGSYSLNGQDVTLSKGQFLAIDGGSYALTGQDVTLAHAYAVPVEAGSYAISGQDVALNRTHTLSVDAGSYALNGQDVALSLDRFVTVEAGSYEVTGQDVALTKTGALAILVEGGSYALSGDDVDLLLGRLVVVDGGSYAILGNDVELELDAAPQPEPEQPSGGGGHARHDDGYSAYYYRLLARKEQRQREARERRAREAQRKAEPQVRQAPQVVAKAEQPDAFAKVDALIGGVLVSVQAAQAAQVAQLEKIERENRIRDEEAAIALLLLD